MTLKRLSSEEMVQVSAGWLSPQGRHALSSHEETAPLVVRIETAHDALAFTTHPTTETPRLAQIREDESQVDARHDDIVKGIHDLLTISACLLGDEGDELLTLRDELLPDGLATAEKPYRIEAAQAQRLSARITPALRARLDAIIVGPQDGLHTLTQFVHEWIAMGKRLGELEEEKSRLQAGSPGGGLALVKARHQWIRVANALVANAEMAELDVATDALLFAPLRAAEKTADRREGRDGAEK